MPPRRPSNGIMRSDEVLIKALVKSGGTITEAAVKLNMSREALHRRIARSIKLQEAVHTIRESMLDLAESKLMSSIKNGEPWAVCFYLKCQGKGRGYTERSEVTGPNGGPIAVSPFERMSDDELRGIADGTDTPRRIG